MLDFLITLAVGAFAVWIILASLFTAVVVIHCRNVYRRLLARDPAFVPDRRQTLRERVTALHCPPMAW